MEIKHPESYIAPGITMEITRPIVQPKHHRQGGQTYKYKRQNGDTNKLTAIA